MLDEIRLAARRLRRSPGFSAAVVLSLALGIGAGVAAFSVIDSVRFRALPFQDGDRLVIVGEQNNGPTPASCLGACNVAYETFANLLEGHPFQSVDLLAGYASGGKALNLGGEPIPVLGGVVSKNLFPMLGVQPLKGRVFAPQDNRLGAEPTVVISADLWKNQLGGDPAILGRVIKLSDTRYTVIGVMPVGFNHEVGSLFWLPSVPTLDPSTKPSIRSVTVLARLRAGRTVAQFRAELGNLDPNALRAARGKDQAPVRLVAAPLRLRYTSATQSHDLTFAMVVAAILLIAAANVINMTLVRALDQRREFAVRAALGAGRSQLVRPLLAEQTLLALVATVGGLAFARWLLGTLQSVAVLQSLRPAGMEYRLDPRTVLFAISLGAVLAIALALIPARLAARADFQILRQGGRTMSVGRIGRRAQSAFVVIQVAAAVVLLSGAGLLVKTVFRLSDLSLGFDIDRVVQASPSYPHPWRVKEKFVPVTRQIAAELASLPGVEAVGIQTAAALGPRGGSPSVTLEGSATPLGPEMTPAVGAAVDTGYFRAVGVRVVRGRGFGGQDGEAGPRVAIVNQWAARHWWPGQDPVGRAIQIDTAPSLPVRLEIVGVVEDNRAASANLLLSADGPEVYQPLDQAPSPFPTFLVRARGRPDPLVKPVTDVMVRQVPDRPVFASTMASQAGQQLSGVRVNAYQVFGFAAVGLLLALIGVHAVLNYTVGRRTQEIGIRGALGASGGEIRRMVLRQTALLAGLGLLIGLPLAGMAGKSLGSLLYGTNPTDPWILAWVAATMLAVALAAGYLPARRASRIDPLSALRSD